jgi:hypothetical protein
MTQWSNGSTRQILEFETLADFINTVVLEQLSDRRIEKSGHENPGVGKIQHDFLATVKCSAVGIMEFSAVFVGHADSADKGFDVHIHGIIIGSKQRFFINF